MKEHKSLRAKLIRANKKADKNLKIAEGIGSLLIIYLTFATAGVIGLMIYAIL